MDNDVKFVVSHLKDAEWKQGAGRRDFMSYRDMGIVEATNGRMKLQANSIVEHRDLSSTGWHYHTCDLQVGYILSGWIDIQFEQDEIIRLSEGDVICIPPGKPHNEVQVSDNFVTLECHLPADMGTVPCDPPPRKAEAAVS